MTFYPPPRPDEPDEPYHSPLFRPHDRPDEPEPVEALDDRDDDLPEPVEELGEDVYDDEPDIDERPVTYRGSTSDPTFGYLVAIALSFGLIPLIPENTDLRYVIVWMALAGFGVMSWLLGTMTPIMRDTVDNLGWGVVFGLIVGTPLLIVGGDTLTTTAQLLFRLEANGQVLILPLGSVLALLVVVQPLGESLFFRGVLQETRSPWLVAGMASLWSFLLFFPLLNIGQFPVIGILIGTALLMMNGIYSYVRQRNGLAAAWLCQIVANFILLFLPLIGL